LGIRQADVVFHFVEVVGICAQTENISLACNQIVSSGV